MAAPNRRLRQAKNPKNNKAAARLAGQLTSKSKEQVQKERTQQQVASAYQRAYRRASVALAKRAAMEQAVKDANRGKKSR